MSSSNNRFSKWDLPKLYPLYAAILTLILYLILYALCGILGYGNNTILSGDLYQQYVAFIRLFLETLKGKGNFWYSFSLYLGSPSASTFAYYCLSPFNLLYLLPGVSTAAMTMVVILLKHALAAASFQYFAQKGLKRTSPLVILFSAAYAMCAFAVTMQIHIMWLDALYILPFLMLVLLRFVRGGSFLPLTAVYAYLFLTNFYMGYIVGIFSALAFTAFLALHITERGKAAVIAVLKKTALFAFSVLLSAGCCAAILLPTASQLLGQRSGDPMGFRYVSITLFDVLGNLFAGQMQSMGSPVPLLYCGLPVLLLLPVYFFSKKIPGKEKLAAFLVIAFYLLATQFFPVYAFVHAFEAPNWYAHRYAFCVSFLLLTLAIRILPEYGDFSPKQYGIYTAALLVFYSLLIPVQALSLSGYTTSSQGYLLLNAAFLGMYLLCLLFHMRKRFPRILPLLFTLSFCAELLCNAHADLSRNSFSTQTEASYSEPEHLEAAAISGIQSADPGLYRIRVVGEGLLNAPSYHHYPGINTFVTYDNEKLRSFMSSLGIAAPFMQLIDQGYTDLTDMLFGIRYAVFLQKDLSVSPMPHPLPIAFLSSPKILSWQDSGNPFLNQETLVDDLSGMNGHYFTPVSFENVDTYSQNMDTFIIDNVIYYQHIADSALNGIIRYSLKEDDGARLYGYVSVGGTSSLDTTTATLEAIPSPFSLPHYLSMKTIAELPVGEDGKHALGIDFTAGPNFDTAVSDVMLYRYDGSALDAAYRELADHGLQITAWSDGFLSGQITADEEHPILFTSIPYAKGWTATVDDQPFPVDAALKDTFLCLYLTPGTHTIVLQYEEPLAMPGCLITALCLVSFLLLLLAGRKKSKAASKKTEAPANNEEIKETADEA